MIYLIWDDLRKTYYLGMNEIRYSIEFLGKESDLVGTKSKNLEPVTNTVGTRS